MTEEQIKKLQTLSEELNKAQVEMSEFQRTNSGKPLDQYLNNIQMVAEQIQILHNQIKSQE